MYVIQFFYGFQFHYDFLIADKIRYKLCLQLNITISDIDRLLTDIGDLKCEQFLFKCILIHFLSKTTTEISMYRHCGTDNIVGFLLIDEILHIIL